MGVDPANESTCSQWAVDVMELVTVQDVMTNLKLGPNGALMYSMEFLLDNADWLLGRLRALPGHYFLFDCPGQVELYTHHNAMKTLMEKLDNEGFRLCAVQLVDSHYCSDPGKYIATLLMSLSSMLKLGMPHVNVLSKIDMAQRHREKLHFGLDFYTEVLDLNYLLEALDEDRVTKRYAKLNAAIVGLVEDFSLVSFLPLSISNKKMLLGVRAAADKANGYVFGSGEERSVQALLACAIGADQQESLDEYDTGNQASINKSDHLLWS